MAQSKARIFRTNTIWAAFGTGVESVGRLVLVVILSKWLGASDYGIWSLVMVVVDICIAMFTFQLPAAMVRFLAGCRDERQIARVVPGVIGCVLTGTLGGALLVGLAAPWLARQFVPASTDLATQGFLVGAGIIVAWGLEITGFEFYRTFLQFRRYALMLAARVTVEIMMMFGLLLAGFGLIHVLIGICIIRLASFAATFGYIITRFRGRIERPGLSFLPSYLGYALPFIIVALLTWFLKLGDRYVVAYFRPTSEVGIYSASYDIAMFMMLLIVPLRRTLYPSLSAAWNARRMEEVGKLLKHSFRYFTLVALPLVLVVLGMSDEIVRTLTQEEFVPLGQYIVPVVAAANFLFGLHAISMFVLMLEERTLMLASLMIIAGISNLTLNLLLVPTRLGILGAALATLISFLILSLLTGWMAYRYVPFGIDWSFSLKALVASVLAAGGIAWLDVQGLTGLIGGFLLAGLVYVCLMYSFRAVSIDELRFLLLGGTWAGQKESRYTERNS